jgi:hypothetical protein
VYFKWLTFGCALRGAGFSNFIARLGLTCCDAVAIFQVAFDDQVEKVIASDGDVQVNLKTSN